MGWVVNTTLGPLYRRERPRIHCIGGWVGPRGRSGPAWKISPPRCDLNRKGARVCVWSRGKRLFSSPKRPDLLWGPPSFLLNGYKDCFPAVKRHGHSVDHWPASKAEVKNERSCASAPPTCPQSVDRDK